MREENIRFLDPRNEKHKAFAERVGSLGNEIVLGLFIAPELPQNHEDSTRALQIAAETKARKAKSEKCHEAFNEISRLAKEIFPDMPMPALNEELKAIMTAALSMQNSWLLKQEYLEVGRKYQGQLFIMHEKNPFYQPRPSVRAAPKPIEPIQRKKEITFFNPLEESHRNVASRALELSKEELLGMFVESRERPTFPEDFSEETKREFLIEHQRSLRTPQAQELFDEISTLVSSIFPHLKTPFLNSELKRILVTARDMARRTPESNVAPDKTPISVLASVDTKKGSDINSQIQKHREPISQNLSSLGYNTVDNDEGGVDFVKKNDQRIEVSDDGAIKSTPTPLTESLNNLVENLSDSIIGMGNIYLGVAQNAGIKAAFPEGTINFSIGYALSNKELQTDAFGAAKVNLTPDQIDKFNEAIKQVEERVRNEFGKEKYDLVREKMTFAKKPLHPQSPVLPKPASSQRMADEQAAVTKKGGFRGGV